MFEDKNNGHTCYCENCLKLQAENEQLRQCLDWIEKYCINIRNISYDLKDSTQFAYYSGAKDTVKHILLDIIKQTKDGGND